MTKDTILYVNNQESMMQAFMTGALMTLIPTAPKTPLIGKILMVEWEDGSGRCFNMRILQSNGEYATIFKRFPPEPPKKKKGRKAPPVPPAC